MKCPHKAFWNASLSMKKLAYNNTQATNQMLQISPCHMNYQTLEQNPRTLETHAVGEIAFALTWDARSRGNCIWVYLGCCWIVSSRAIARKMFL
jgi:hypothetical protein